MIHTVNWAIVRIALVVARAPGRGTASSVKRTEKNSKGQKIKKGATIDHKSNTDNHPTRSVQNSNSQNRSTVSPALLFYRFLRASANLR